MLGVFGVAVAFGLGIPAFLVLRNPGFHVHVWINPAGRPKTLTGEPILPDMVPTTILRVESRPSPFWPRYGRCLIGLPWLNQPLCDLDPERIAETCEYAHPNMVDGTIGGGFLVRWPAEVLAEGRKRYPDLFPIHSNQPAWQAGP